MKKRIVSLVTALVLSCICLVCLPLQVRAEDDSEVLAQAKKGVAQIYALGYDRNGSPESSWVGSGFAVGEAGKDSDVFLTNWHVATGDGEYTGENVRIWILLDNAQIDSDTYEPQRGKAVECEVLYTTNGYPDIAVIRAMTDIKGFEALPLLAADEAADGARVYALGYPGVVDAFSSSTSGVDDITITSGIISKHMTDVDGIDVLMHDAHIQGGNSGGPLITAKGAAIGLNTYGFGKESATEYLCAVYIDYAMDALDSLDIDYDVYKEPGTLDPKLLVMGGIAAAVLVVIGLVVVLIVVLTKKPAPKAAPAPSPVRYRLRTPDGQYMPITEEGVLIGRTAACRLRFPENTRGVSRVHCRVSISGGSPTLTDMGSTYGTFLDGAKLPAQVPVSLRPGSRFYLGSEKHFFILEQDN